MIDSFEQDVLLANRRIHECDLEKNVCNLVSSLNFGVWLESQIFRFGSYKKKK